MKLTRNTNDRNIIINTEQDFQTNLGWEENLVQFEDEVLKDIINPVDNYETVRFIHKPYTGSTLPTGKKQTDIWFQFFFLNNSSNYVQNYEAVGILNRENELMLRQSTESFFRLEFFKTPLISGTTYEYPTRKNRRLVFTKNLSLPLGEKFLYITGTTKYYIHIPVFFGNNYKNKENMYLFWFEDEKVLEDTNLIGVSTGNTFFMTAKFYNAKDGSIVDFTNRPLSTGTTIDERYDMYYKVDFDFTDKTYLIYKLTGSTVGDRVGINTESDGLISINFYEKGGGTVLSQPTLPPSPTTTPTPTPMPTHTPYPTLTPTPTPTLIPEPDGLYNYLLLEKCSDGSQVWSDGISGDLEELGYTIGVFVYDQNNNYYEIIDFNYLSYNPNPTTSIVIQGTAVGCPTPTPTPTATSTTTPTPTPTIPTIYPFNLGFSSTDGLTACSDYSSSPATYYSYNPPPLANGTILYTGGTYPLEGNALTGYYSDGTNYGYVPGNSGVINGITNCNVTPTPTPTATPIYQGVAIYTGVTFSGSSIACANGSSPNGSVYVSITELPVGDGDRLYTNTNLTTNFVGNDQFYRIFINPSWYVARISAAGYISEFTICSITPTFTPTPTPTVTATPLPSYTSFYISSPVDRSTTGTTYCSSPGYIMSQEVKSTSSTISGMLNNTVYDGSSLLPYTGPGSPYVYAISTTQSENTYTVGTWNWIEIDSSGQVTDVGLQSCSGGGAPQ